MNWERAEEVLRDDAQFLDRAATAEDEYPAKVTKRVAQIVLLSMANAIRKAREDEA